MASIPPSCSSDDWQSWQPTDRATLLFVVEQQRILLIRKKRGLGAGKINGPGGKLEAGEQPLDGAIREVEEELLTTPIDVEPVGNLSFQFVDGYGIYVHVFRGSGVSGEPSSTVEADPIWAPLDAIPYDEMWADDRLWLPWMLDGRAFEGRFVFDGDNMLDWELTVRPRWRPATDPLPS